MLVSSNRGKGRYRCHNSGSEFSKRELNKGSWFSVLDVDMEKQISGEKQTGRALGSSSKIPNNIIKESSTEVNRQGITGATTRVEANVKTSVPTTLVDSIVDVTESISLPDNSIVDNFLARPISSSQNQLNNSKSSLLGKLTFDFVPMKEGSSLQEKSLVSKAKSDAHIVVIISDSGMQDGMAN
ncbi:hypothetical protein V6N13_020278 [Hibiscus sabdariffa]